MKQTDDVLLKILWDYLEIQSPLQHADVIIAGGCTDPGVGACAAELYTLGFAPIILLTGYKQAGMQTTEADFHAAIARDRGVPDSAILRETQAANTGQNITFSQQLLLEKGIIPKTVMLVHKPYMTRRFLATAEAQWEGELPTFIVRHEQISLAEYSMKRGRDEAAFKMLGDFQRMVSYAKKGFQSKQNIPSEVQEAYDVLISHGHRAR
jgi:uncharacterized SAM-binding protein YcdF (DUF218 family)